MPAGYTLEVWLEALEQRPLDADLWESLALWLIDDCDDADGAMWARWCWQEKLLPACCHGDQAQSWGWRRRGQGHVVDGYCPSALVPPGVYRHLPVEVDVSPGVDQESYPTFSEALLALLAAWRNARALGWSPAEM
jgi:hypothetical protein